ncbi:MAG: hypothetical protein H6712_02490 [Myxococcales bacterium]|nr:hypothetical protein [Myxococcales bacterium]MCB9712697.1 hypothetical protein [Myxococcales bacterium]
MWKTLVIIATVVLGTQTTVEAEAVAGGACQTSGNEVVWDYAGDPNADFADAPKAVQNGMNRHAQNLGADPATQTWPDCWVGEVSWGCQDGKMFCQCVRISGTWGCGCESGEC